MSISRIKITNLLSFDFIEIKDFKDINCIVGMNNAGKSNFLKLILFFYDKLNKKRVLSPRLNNNYTPHGTISITYDMQEIQHIVTKKKNIGKSDIFSAIFNTFFSDKTFKTFIGNLGKHNIISSTNDLKEYTLTLTIFKNESIEWSTENKEVLKFINYLYPFFYINTRDIDLHNWDYIWEMVSKIKTYKIKEITQEKFTNFIDKELSISTKRNHTKFTEDITKINNIIKKYNLDLSSFSYNEKLINYIKSGLEGHNFNFHGEEIDIQSDGTNSSNYIQIFISLLITLSRREYIIPALYIDEPEIGLHPKKSEELIYNIYDLYKDLNERTTKKQYPHILFSTHSPNILKVIIKLFEDKQQVLHFSKIGITKSPNKDIHNTKISKLKSTYEDSRFLNRFTDNEARLFFSKFILFVEGETELELFSHKKLLNYFPKLKEIDIYQTADLTKIKYINPSYMNSNIPYYILYDLDKIVKIEKKFILTNDNHFNFEENLKESKYKSPTESGLDSKIPTEKVLLNYITNNNSHQIKYTTEDNITIKTFECNNLKVGKYSWKKNDFQTYFSLLHTYLKYKNILVNRTTIENTIINKNNIDFFLDWLMYELKTNMRLKEYYNYKNYAKLKKAKAYERYHKSINHIYTKYLQNVNLNNKLLVKYLKSKKNNKIKNNKKYKKQFYYDLITEPLESYCIHFNNFFTYSKKDQYNDLHRFKIDYLNKLKEKRIEEIKYNIIKLKTSVSNDVFTYLFVLLFNGKTECLRKIKYFEDNNADINEKLTILKESLCHINHFFDKDTGKTSSWVTEFLNFYLNKKQSDYSSLDNIEKNKSIKKDFKKDFNDLYDIIESINLKLVV